MKSFTVTDPLTKQVVYELKAEAIDDAVFRAQKIVEENGSVVTGVTYVGACARIACRMPFGERVIYHIEAIE